MNERPPPTDEQLDGAWRRLIAAAEATDDQPYTLPPGFDERVLTAVPGKRVELNIVDRQRLVDWAGVMSLAASLAFVVWNWPTVVSLWSNTLPLISSDIVQVEPWQ